MKTLNQLMPSFLGGVGGGVEGRGVVFMVRRRGCVAKACLDAYRPPCSAKTSRVRSRFCCLSLL